MILERDGYRCRYCQVSVTNASANIDHIKPWKFGGPTTPDNLVTACQDCNKAKGNKPWKAQQRIRRRTNAR